MGRIGTGVISFLPGRTCIAVFGVCIGIYVWDPTGGCDLKSWLEGTGRCHTWDAAAMDLLFDYNSAIL